MEVRFHQDCSGSYSHRPNHPDGHSRDQAIRHESFVHSACTHSLLTLRIVGGGEKGGGEVTGLIGVQAQAAGNNDLAVGG